MSGSSSLNRWSRPRRLLLALILLLAACGGSPEQDPGPQWLVVGIDGADWGVINALWEEGKLPHLRDLAERGVAGVLRTDYGASPVIWTTVATGVVPRVHGITGFAIPTPDGDVPVSSAVRKVPALWNMLTSAGRRTAVVSWWASWPAERIAGVVVSDRAESGVRDGLSPRAFRAQFERWKRAAAEEENLFDRRLTSARRDHLTQFSARKLVNAGFDLVMVYFRGVDIASHRYWKYYEPERFPEVEPAQAEELGSLVPSTYEATDAAIGRLLVAVGPETNVMVLSDHGFYAMKREEVRIMLDFDRILTRLGFQQRERNKIDWPQTELYTFSTAKFRPIKRVRYAPAVPPEARAGLRARLTDELAKITYAGGEPVFSVRDPGRRERQTGADFVVDVARDGATRHLHYGERIWKRAIPKISSLSGTHSQRTHGVVFAAGPDVDPAAILDGIDIHDIAPTILYGLGLPVGEDFAGRAWVELFSPEYRSKRPLRTVATWGIMDRSEAVTSAADEEILDDLRALGYID